MTCTLLHSLRGFSRDRCSVLAVLADSQVLGVAIVVIVVVGMTVVVTAVINMTVVVVVTVVIGMTVV